MDQWQSHVMHEVTDAFQDDDRLLRITELMMDMSEGGLVPEPIADAIFIHINNINTGG
jgi:hypothetical protein